MPSLKFDQIAQQIQEQKLSPVYLLWGEEDYYIDRLTEIFENQILDPMQKEFDFSLFFGQDLKGKEPGLKGVIAQCKQFPVMSPLRLTIIKEAQNIDRWEPLENYLQKPLENTTLVLCYKHKKPDKRKSFYKLIEKNGVTFESAPIKEKDLSGWITQYLKQAGYNIAQEALMMLTETMGTNLNLLSNELNKLFVNLPQGSTITDDHIETYIGINKEYNVFTLEKAISGRNFIETRKICEFIRRNPKDFPAPLILIQFYRLFARTIQIHDFLRKGTPHQEWAVRLGVNPFFIQQYEATASRYNYRDCAHILNIIHSYDLKSKGVDADLTPEDWVDEITTRILYAC